MSEEYGMLESRIQTLVVKYIRNLGGIAVKVDASVVGWPDLTAILPNGVVLFLEVKQPKGRLRPAQRRTHDKLERLNANVYTVHSVEEAKAAIQRHYPGTT